MSSKSNVLLIPWDPESIVHRQILLKQRIECSWHQEKVEGQWRELQRTGGKCIYWIADETIQDTATSINAVAREPSQAVFTPIGHISLDSVNPEAKGVELGIPSSGAFWIKTFYVTQCLQSQGIGRAAMDQVEEMAIREPLNAKTLLLDTVEKDDQMREDFAIISYGAVPKVPNEVWYGRRGYRLIKTVLNFYNIHDKNGKIWDTKTVFMRKDIL
ncbi:hypothetical protein N7493_006722 [Penicillium malachiteum]|uniref:N-acetyltransferase domain-containing protein n=1 Tax=Penicillium malachiteum TaxID=1324776 RepID=A0AAD6MV04_9EURO|nr:hypothetical protein N7493_006722 [Penicillium malachiteum]